MEIRGQVSYGREEGADCLWRLSDLITFFEAGKEKGGVGSEGGGWVCRVLDDESLAKALDEQKAKAKKKGAERGAKEEAVVETSAKKTKIRMVRGLQKLPGRDAIRAVCTA